MNPKEDPLGFERFRRTTKKLGFGDDRGLDRLASRFTQYRTISEPRRNYRQENRPSIVEAVYHGPNLIPVISSARVLEKAFSGLSYSERFHAPSMVYWREYPHTIGLMSLKNAEATYRNPSFSDKEKFMYSCWFFDSDTWHLVPPFRRRSDKGSMVVEDFMALAIQPLARDSSVPSDLKPLADMAKNFFEYSLGYFTNLHIDNFQELKYLVRGTLHKDATLAPIAYAPARLGLLPQTIAEIYLARAGFSSNKGHWEGFQDRAFNFWLKGAYPENTLPDGEVDPSVVHVSDRRPAKILAEKSFEGVERGEDLDGLLVELSAFRKALRADILNAPGQTLRIEPSSNSPFRELHITAHNARAASRYKTTLIILAFPQDSSTPVLLEMDKTGRIWGTPAEVLKKDRHGEEILTRDIAHSLINYGTANSATRQIGPEYLRDKIRKPFVKISDETNGEEPQESKVKTKTEPKIKVKTKGVPDLRAVIDRYPDSIEAVESKATIVEYDKSQIEQIMGSTRDEKIIDRMLADIAAFEETGRGIYLLEEAKKRGLKVYGLKSGSYRIILIPEDNSYKVETILHRSDYNNANLGNLMRQMGK